MSKWNKPNKVVSEQFLQNEQRRKQIIIEAARRRKQKEKKIQQQDQKDRREEEEALKRHKQEKKDAYIKYLHNNLHDKYEHLQRLQKEAKPQIKSNAKWKKKTVEENSNQLEALDLEVKMESKVQQQPSMKPQKQSNVSKHQRQELIDQFQKEWDLQQSKDELLGSKLLDSLDLDIDTINRGKQVKQIMREQPKNEEIKELRQIIGYQSIVFGQKQESKINLIAPKEIKATKQTKQSTISNKTTQNNAVKKAQINQVQTLNELKRKKQAKILNWAIEQQQEAEDLFSNCSSKKKPTIALKQLNQELKNAKQSKPSTNKVNNNLPTITEQPTKNNPPVIKQLTQNKSQPIKPPNAIRSNAIASKSRQQPPRQPANSTQPNFKKKTSNKDQSVDRKNKLQQQARQTKKSSKTTTGFTSEKNLIRMRTTSKDKPRNQSKQKNEQKVQPLRVVQVPKKIGGQLPPLPARTDNNSIATYDMQIDIESFIKQDLLNLNEQQMKIQQQLRLIHKQHKNSIKDMYNKYEIKTDYKHSNQIIGEEPTKPSKYYQNEDDIEQSLQNLDNMLIRKELVTRQKQNAIKEVTQQDSLSYINPFSNSDDLCNQVLKLAKNVSRFEKKVDEPAKDGYQIMMTKAKKNQKNSSFQKNQQKSRVSRGRQQKQSKYQEQGLSQSQDVSHVTQALGRPPNILQLSPKQQKIHVNAKLLKNLLLDD